MDGRPYRGSWVLMGTAPYVERVGLPCIHSVHPTGVTLAGRSDLDGLPMSFCVRFVEHNRRWKEGNMGYIADSLFPALEPSGVGVGLLDQSGTVSSFSSPLAVADEDSHQDNVYVQRRAKVQNSRRLNWTPEAIASFEETKKAIANAIALTVPDWEGASDGTNPFFLFADRSLGAIGVGLFQRPRAGAKLPLRLRNQLRPLGMMSKSLDATQRNWIVWEGELYAVRESMYHFRSIISGFVVVVGTDRLNSFLVSSVTELRQPAKVLRWLQEIEGMARVKWAFTPGTANLFADFASRHPPDRDQLEEKLVEQDDLPQTLQDAFRQVLGWFGIGGKGNAVAASDEEHAVILRVRSSLDGWVTCRRQSSGTAAERGIVHPLYSLDQCLKPVRGAEAFPAKRIHRALLAPGCLPESAGPVEFSAQGVHCDFNFLVVLEPPIILEEGTRKWFEMRVEKAQEAPGKVRGSIHDSIILLLRTAARLSPTVLFLHGESGWAGVGACHDGLRKEAFSRRRVQSEEASLEKAWDAVEALVFPCPCWSFETIDFELCSGDGGSGQGRQAFAVCYSGT